LKNAVTSSGIEPATFRLIETQQAKKSTNRVTQLVKAKLERIWKKKNVSLVEAQMRHLPRGNEEHHEKPQSRQSVTWRRFELQIC
jgi:hypothetical protein